MKVDSDWLISHEEAARLYADNGLTMCTLTVSENRRMGRLKVIKQFGKTYILDKRSVLNDIKLMKEQLKYNETLE